MSERYRHEDLLLCTRALFERAGLAEPIAGAVAEVLVEADLLGYSTHGLQFVPAYLEALEAGRWNTRGEPVIASERDGALVLDANWLPGQWAMSRAVEIALDRAARRPVVSVVVRRAQNASCLAVYARRVALTGRIALLMASAPADRAVAPHGGRLGTYSTNPIAAAIPRSGPPILIDTSTASTSNRAVERAVRAGARLTDRVLVDEHGVPSDRPEALRAGAGGAIVPAGGLSQGHKGYALGLLVEALTAGLCGLGGRHDEAGQGGNVLHLQIIDPDAFGGGGYLRAETDWLAARCAGAPVREGADAVRVPGDRAAAAYARQEREGVELHPEIMARMVPCLRRLGIDAPAPIGAEAEGGPPPR